MEEEQEHKMQRFEKPQVAQAKFVCYVSLIAAIATIVYYYLFASPATKVLINHYSTWPCYVVGGIVLFFAIRALLAVLS